MPDTLWLDTSVLRQLKGRERDRLAKLGRQKGVRIVVHAHIHLEYCRQLRGSSRARGLVFEPSVIATSLEQLGFVIADASFDRATAESWAELLDRRYPDDEAWQGAKLEALKARLPEDAGLRTNEVPMTTDWLVALEIEHQEAFVAVADKGPEWRALKQAEPSRALSYPEAIQWLEGRVDLIAPS